MKRKQLAAAAVLACLAFGCGRTPDKIPVMQYTPRPGPAKLEAPALSREYEAALEMPPAVVIEEPVPEIIQEEAAPAYTDEELETLAIIIYQEAGGDACSDETRSMVGTVVMNRVASDHFPDTIQEVATQERQYGRLYWTGLVWPERANNPGEAHAVQRAYDCARAILEGERALPEDVIWQAEFPQGTEIVAHQDGLYFCR
jgi:hypothetical protein